MHVASGRGSDRRENARSDHRADAQRDEVPRPQSLLELMPFFLGLRDQSVERLRAKELAEF